MIYEDEFIYFRAEAKKRPKEPYIFVNPELAEDFYIRLKEELPEVTKHDLGDQSFICITPEARKKVIKNLKARIKKYKTKILEAERVIADVDLCLHLKKGAEENESNID